MRNAYHKGKTEPKILPYVFKGVPLSRCVLFWFSFSVSGEVRVPGLQNGGPGWEEGGERPAPAYQPREQGALPGPQGAPQPPPPGPQGDGAGGGGQMNKKPTRRPGIKPPPDRAKRSIYLFSLKNPIRQLFIKVNSKNLHINYIKGCVSVCVCK